MRRSSFVLAVAAALLAVAPASHAAAEPIGSGCPHRVWGWPGDVPPVDLGSCRPELPPSPVDPEVPQRPLDPGAPTPTPHADPVGLRTAR